MDGSGTTNVISNADIPVSNVNNNTCKYDKEKIHLTFNHADSFEANDDDGFNLFVDKTKINSYNYYNNIELPLYSDSLVHAHMAAKKAHDDAKNAYNIAQTAFETADAADKNAKNTIMVNKKTEEEVKKTLLDNATFAMNEHFTVYSLDPELKETDNHQHNAVFDYGKMNDQKIISSWSTTLCTQNDYIRVDTIDENGNRSNTVPLQVISEDLVIDINETTNIIMDNIVKRSNLTVEIDGDNTLSIYDHDQTNILKDGIEYLEKTTLIINGLPYKVTYSQDNIMSVPTGTAAGIYKNCVLVHYNVEANIIYASAYESSIDKDINDETDGAHNYFKHIYGDDTTKAKKHCIENFNLKLRLNCPSTLLRGYGQNDQTENNDLTTTRRFIYPLDKFELTTVSTEWINSSGTYSSHDEMNQATVNQSVTHTSSGDVQNLFDLTYNFRPSYQYINEPPCLTGMMTNQRDNNTNTVYQFGTQYLTIDGYTSPTMIKHYYDSHANLCLDGEEFGLINEIAKLFTLKSSTNNPLNTVLKTHDLGEDNIIYPIGGLGNN
jgi:hypothetical protein